MPSADPPAPPRIGLLCLFGECHFLRAPVPAEEHRWLAYFEGPALLAAMDDPGEPIASTQSPIRRLLLSPNVTGVSGLSDFTRRSARSVR